MVSKDRCLLGQHRYAEGISTELDACDTLRRRQFKRSRTVGQWQCKIYNIKIYFRLRLHKIISAPPTPVPLHCFCWPWPHFYFNLQKTWLNLLGLPWDQWACCPQRWAAEPLAPRRGWASQRGPPSGIHYETRQPNASQKFIGIWSFTGTGI